MSRRDPLTYEIIGAAFAVHNSLGSGFLEAVYHEAMIIELKERNVPFLHEVELPIFYKGTQLKTYYRADFVCFESIIVELKALKTSGGIEKGQLLNYMKAAKLKKGLLINFGKSSLDYERMVL